MGLERLSGGRDGMEAQNIIQWQRNRNMPKLFLETFLVFTLSADV